MSLTKHTLHDQDPYVATYGTELEVGDHDLSGRLRLRRSDTGESVLKWEGYEKS